MPIGLFAQATCTVNGRVTDCSSAGALSLVILIPLIILGVISFIGWLMMLIHAIQHDIPNKAVWIIVMVLFNVGWIIYYFAVKRPYDQAHKTVGGTIDQPPTTPVPSATDDTPPQTPVL